MNIAIDISPLSSGHRVRGVGFYVKTIKDNIEKIDKKNSYTFFESGNIPRNADLVHFPYFDPFFITLPIINTKKFIVTVHDLTPLVFPGHFPAGMKGRARWFLQRQLLKRARLVISDSDCSRRDVIKILGIPEDRVKTVYLAADPMFRKLTDGLWKPDILKKYSLPNNFLLYVGDATWNKNLPRLIAAVKKTSHKLVLIGKVWSKESSDLSSNPWNEDLRAVLNEIQGKEQFIKLGFVPGDDLVKIYNLATAAILPSIYEGFGLPVLEALASGCPVITSRGGSIPEVAGQAVSYIDATSIDNIRDGISRVMNNRVLRENLSKKGLMQSKKFTVEELVKNLVKVYETS